MLTQAEKVERYFKATLFDYHALWVGRKDLALHFGYYEPGIRSHSKALINMNNALAKRVGITPEDRVLDAGCGYGGSAIWLAEQKGCRVVGINILAFQLKKARRCAVQRGVADKASFTEADCTDTRLPDRSFSVVWGLESIVHVPDKPAFIAEAFRLLKSGGRIVIAEYTLRETPELSQHERAELRPWLEGWAMPSLLTATEYVHALEEAGFRNVRVENITQQVGPSLRRLARFLPFGVPIGLAMRKLRLFSAEHLGNILATKCQMETLKKGYWQYSIITAEKP
jgi:tocopherol O-methyltransferase